MTTVLDFRDPEWVAEKLNLDKNAVYRYLNEGVLPGLQLGRKWLISESTLVEWLKAEERRQTQERQFASKGPGMMLYTGRATRMLELARGEAITRNHDYIGTEHLLFALVAESNPNAGSEVLARMGVDRSAVVAAVNATIGNGTDPVEGPIGLTPRARKAVDLAVTEAGAMNHMHVGCEHFLLGLIAQGDGVAAVILKALGVSLESTRDQVRDLVAAVQATATET